MKYNSSKYFPCSLAIFQGRGKRREAANKRVAFRKSYSWTVCSDPSSLILRLADPFAYTRSRGFGKAGQRDV